MFKQQTCFKCAKPIASTEQYHISTGDFSPPNRPYPPGVPIYFHDPECPEDAA